MKAAVCLIAMVMKSTLIWNMLVSWNSPKALQAGWLLCSFLQIGKKIKGIGELLSSMGLADNECPKVIVQ